MNNEQTIEILRQMMTIDGKAEVLTILTKYIHTAGVIAEGIDKIKPSIDAIHTTTKTRKGSPVDAFEQLFTGGKGNPFGGEVETDKDIRNIAKQLSTLLKIQKQQQTLLMNMSAIMMAYIISGSIDNDAAQTMIKMGNGDEAVRTIWESKLKG